MSQADPFSADTDKFAPEHFYTGLGNDPMATSMRLPGWIYEVMASLIETVPQYNTKSEIVRDALVHRLHYLQGKDPALRAKFAMYLAWAEADRVMAEHNAFENQFGKFKDMLMTRGMSPGVTARIRESILNAADASTDPEWRDRYMALLN